LNNSRKMNLGVSVREEEPLTRLWREENVFGDCETRGLHPVNIWDKRRGRIIP